MSSCAMSDLPFDLPTSVRVQSSTDKGRSLHAVTAFEAGTFILKPERPFISTLSTKFLTTQCLSCFKPANALRCSACKSARYCSVQCQREDMVHYKKGTGECEALCRWKNRFDTHMKNQPPPSEMVDLTDDEGNLQNPDITHLRLPDEMSRLLFRILWYRDHCPDRAKGQRIVSLILLTE